MHSDIALTDELAKKAPWIVAAEPEPRSVEGSRDDMSRTGDGYSGPSERVAGSGGLKRPKACLRKKSE